MDHGADVPAPLQAVAGLAYGVTRINLLGLDAARWEIIYRYGSNHEICQMLSLQREYTPRPTPSMVHQMYHATRRGEGS